MYLAFFFIITPLFSLYPFSLIEKAYIVFIMYLWVYVCVYVRVYTCVCVYVCEYVYDLGGRGIYAPLLLAKCASFFFSLFFLLPLRV